MGIFLRDAPLPKKEILLKKRNDNSITVLCFTVCVAFPATNKINDNVKSKQYSKSWKAAFILSARLPDGQVVEGNPRGGADKAR